MTVTSSLPYTPPVTDSIETLRTEAAVVLRTVDHITTDLDHFSRSIRLAGGEPQMVAGIEKHLGQARRNCAEASTIAAEIIRRCAAAGDGGAFYVEAQEDENLLRDAFARLGLADSAYLRAFDLAGNQ